MKEKKIICSSGRWQKYDEEKYIGLIVSLLKVCDCKYHHVGFIPEKSLLILKEKINLNNIDLNRFFYVENVESVWKYALEKNVDIYLSSFPFGGGRVTLEMMGAGIPILIYKHSIKTLIEMIPKHLVCEWETYSDVVDFVNFCSIKTLNEIGSNLRTFYLENHSFDKFKMKIINL